MFPSYTTSLPTGFLLWRVSFLTTHPFNIQANAKITQQIEELKAETNTIEAEEKVLPKLTQEEKTILGIK
jgi:hypothetical protein